MKGSPTHTFLHSKIGAKDVRFYLFGQDAGEGIASTHGNGKSDAKMKI